jgi:hypothetical protein
MRADLRLVALPDFTSEGLCDFVRTVARVWTSTPYIWAAMATAPRIPQLRLWFELDPARLLSVIVWAYLLESGVQYLEAHPRSAMRICEAWRSIAESGSLGGTMFIHTKRASLFKDPRIPFKDATRLALTLNLNIAEAVLFDLGTLQITNALNGAAMLGDFTCRVTPSSAQHPHDFGDFYLSDAWIRLYVLWNLSFVCHFSQPEVLCKLLIPSVVTGSGARWLSRRAWALRMTVLCPFSFNAPDTWDLGEERAHFARQAAAIRPSVVRERLLARTAESAVAFVVSNATRALLTGLSVAEYVMWS